MSLLTRLRALVLDGWSFWLKDGQLAYRVRKNQNYAEVLAELKPHKAELIELLQQNPDCTRVLPLSVVQQALWFEWQKAPQSSAYNVAFALEVTGTIDGNKLAEAFDALLSRHQALRCHFVEYQLAGEQLAQVLAQENSEPNGVFELFSVPSVSDDELKALVYRHNEVPFEIDKRPPVRLQLFSRTERQHVLLLSFHHIIADGFSQINMIVELFGHYQHLIHEQSLDLTVATPNYGDFVLWQQQLLASEQGNKLIDYWQQQLDGAPTLLDLPLDRPRGEAQSFNGDLVEFSLDQALHQLIEKYAKAHGLTHYNVLLSTWFCLLYRYSHQEDILLGAPLLGRSEQQFGDTVGNFVDPVVMRGRFNNQLSFIDFCLQVRDTVTDALAHQELPFATMVEQLKPKRYPGAGVFFQTSFVLNKFWQFNQYDHQSGHYFELDLAAYPIHGQKGMSDLDLVMEDHTDAFTGVIKFNRDLFDRSTIEGMALHFKTLLASGIANGEQPISQLALLTDAQVRQIDQQLFAPDVNLSSDDLPLIRQFEQLAQAQPLANALDDGTERLNYQQLNCKANQLARLLQQQAPQVITGDEHTPLIGVCMDRHVNMVILLLAIQKLGGAWVPLDPSHPAERLEHIIRDSGVSLVVTDSQYNRQRLPVFDSSIDFVDLSQFDSATVAQLAADNLAIAVPLTQLAYVIYTSGSTGLPKGVMVEQGNLANFIAAMAEQFEFGGEQHQFKGRWLAATGLSFDISILELLCPLARGLEVLVAAEQRMQAYESALENQHLPIGFSLYYFASDIGDSHPNKYDLLLQGAAFADEHGFEAVWTPERHFDTFGGLYPNPAITSSAIAAITKNVGIRSGSCVLPLHNPLRVVEDWSVIDNLSGGRVGMAFAPGWQANDFIIDPDAYEGRHQQLKDGLAEVRALWRGDEVIKHTPDTGKGSEALSVTIKPRPLQPELPVWLTIGGNPEAFRAAGEAGFNILTHLLGQSLEDLQNKIDIYRQAWQQAGHAGKGQLTLMLHTFVSDDQDKALALVEKPFKTYLAQSLALMKNTALEMGIDLDAIDDEQFQQVLQAAFNRYKNSSALFGTPEHCLNLVDKVKGLGVDEIACLIDFGIDSQSVIDSLPHLQKLHQLSQARSHTRALTIAEWFMRQQAHQLAQITHFQCTPSLLGALIIDKPTLTGLAQLDYLLVGGEALSLQLVKDLYGSLESSTDKLPQLINMYGPTETTIWSSCWHYCFDAAQVALGNPLRNTRLYVVDADLNRVPVGHVGELLIAGCGVSRGYMNREDLNQQRYVLESRVNAEVGDDASRAYLTGDLVRLTSQGQLIYVGRNDSQVKLRGLRVELGEIERQLELIPGVKVAVVLCLSLDDLPERLLGFILPETDIEVSELDSQWLVGLQKGLAQVLPQYMVPAVLTLVDGFALNSNGKIDRNQLAVDASSIMATHTSSVGNVAASNESYSEMINSAQAGAETQAEQVLLGIWSQLLKVDESQLGIDDNFFDLGGDSIVAIHLVSRATNAGLAMKVNQLLKYPTIRQLASQLELVEVIEVPQAAVTGQMAMLPIQLAFFEHVEQMDHHNQAALLQLHSQLSLDDVVAMFCVIVTRHDALRMKFYQADSAFVGEYVGYENEALVAKVQDAVEFIRCDADFSDLTAKAEQLQRGLNLAQGDLFKLALFDNAQGEQRLLIIIHHLAVDGVSWRILLDDLLALINQLKSQQTLQLAAKTVSYQAWGQHLQAYAQNIQPQLQQQLPYWQKALSTDVVMLSETTPQTADWSQRLGKLDIQFDSAITEQLLVKANNAYRTQINELLLTALVYGINQLVDDSQLAKGHYRVDMEGHGREAIFDHVDISQSIGWFTTVYPLLINAPDADWSQLICAVKESQRQLPQNGIGFGVLKYLSDSDELRQAHYTARGQILFNYLGQFDASSNAHFSFAPESSGDAISVPQQLIWGINFNGLVRDGQLQFLLTFDRQKHTDEQMQALATHFEHGLLAISEHCCVEGVGQFTPSDFPLAGLSSHGLSKQQLDSWQRDFDIVDIYPTTQFQQGLLLLQSTTYISQLVMEMQDLDVAAFELAWQKLVDTHDIFRTVFVGLDGMQPYQMVLKSAKLRWKNADISDLASDEQEALILSERQAERAAGADPLQAPLMRFNTWDIGQGRIKVLWTYHHCLTDGWSVPLVFEQLSEIYQAICHQQPVVLPTTVPYRDYVEWLVRTDHSRAEQYWRESMSDVDTITPSSDSSDANLEAVIKEIEYRFDPSQSEVFTLAARHHSVTISVLVQAAWAAMLAVNSDVQRDHAVFGTVLAGRSIDLAGVDKIVGPFINTIPVKIDMPADTPVTAWLKQILSDSADRDNFGYLPLSDIKRAANLVANREWFDTVLVDNSVQNNNFSDDIDWQAAGLKLNHLENVQEVNFPLSMNFVLVRATGELVLTWRYDQTRYSAAEIRRRAEALNFVLAQFASAAKEAPTSDMTVAQLRDNLQQQQQQLAESAKKAFKSKRRGRAGRTRAAVTS